MKIEQECCKCCKVYLKWFHSIIGIRHISYKHETEIYWRQKHKVAIVRATMKCPRMSLLDEAGSAIDAESTRVVEEPCYRTMVN